MTPRSNTSRIKKLGYTTLIGAGLFAGAAGIAASATGTTPPPNPPAVAAHHPAAPAVADSPEANDTPDAAGAATAQEANDVGAASEPAGDNGVDCENGIDTATQKECDGGPSANQDNRASEAHAASEAPGVENNNG